MTSPVGPRHPGLSQRVRAVGGAVPRLVTRARRDPPPEPVALLGLVALALLLDVAGTVYGAAWVPAATQVVPLLGGGLLLNRRRMRRLTAVVVLCVGYDLLRFGLDDVRAGALVALVVTGLVSYEFARSREETGLAGLSGESVIVELRQRLLLQGTVPPLPAGWHAEAVVKPAGGGPFGGDFVVSTVSDAGHRLEVALVDVSGKGVDAGTRALLLSGALGGLLGQSSPSGFLPAANAYLVRQAWDEGFATAVHLVVDLGTGGWTLESAGHPPVACFDAGSGRWSLVEAEGVALGLLPDVEYAPVSGRLDPGDALLLYTDGLVEVSGRDLAVGIDKLLGEAERLVAAGFAGGGELLVDRVAPTSSDDRGLVLLWRAA
jgi:Stage II sporulation protein E (SpoIIE)